MLAEQGAIQSTRGAALEYAPPMRSTSFLVPAFLLLVGACQDPEPENLPGEFGEPCVEGSLANTPDGCTSGHVCWQGYCEQTCEGSADCDPVEGWTRECVVGQCQTLCADDKSCPQTLAIPMECWINDMWCAAVDDS